VEWLHEQPLVYHEVTGVTLDECSDNLGMDSRQLVEELNPFGWICR
jgi:hypothetical protein